MRCVAIETVPLESENTRLYRIACAADSTSRGEAHLFASTVEAAWSSRADALAVYFDLGLPEQSYDLVRAAIGHGQPVLLRSLPSWSTESGSRTATYERLTKIVLDPAAARLAEQTLELSRIRSFLSDLASTLEQPLDHARRVMLAQSCSRAALALAPGLTPADSSALFAAIQRSL